MKLKILDVGGTNAKAYKAADLKATTTFYNAGLVFT